MSKVKKPTKIAVIDFIGYVINSVKKNFITKLVFFILSVILWFYINLQKEFETIISIPINVSNIQKGKTLLNPVPDQARMKIRSKGKALLMSDFNNEIFLEIDASGFSDSVNVRLNTDQFINTSDKDLEALTIYQPLEVVVQFDKLLIKKIPIIQNSEFSLMPGYLKTGKFIIDPESLTVSGPESKVKHVDNVVSVKDIQKDLNKDYSANLALVLNDSSSIQYSNKKVRLYQQIARKGITVFKAPVKIINKPEKTNLLIDPIAVDINVTGPVNELQNISSDDFTATADASKLDRYSNKIPIKITSDVKLDWNCRVEEVKAIQY